MNPLLSTFTTPFTTAPFSSIKNEHFKPAIEAEIISAKKVIDVLVNNKETPTFQNTIEALEFVGMQMKRVTSIFFNLNSAETNDELQKIAQEVSPILSDFANDIRLNQELFERVKVVFDKKSTLDLTTEQGTLLNNQYKSFVRNGANLSEDDKEKLRAIDKQASKLSLQFGENILAETNAFKLHIIDKNQLKGLPDGAKEAAYLTAKQKEKEGWLFTLDYPSYVPFMTYIEDRKLREQMARAFGARSF